MSNQNIHAKISVLSPKQITRILVIKLRHFGDVLLTTPVFSTLKANYPDSLIDVLVYKGTEAIICCNQELNQIYTVDRELKHAGVSKQLQGEKQLFTELKKQKYDLVLNLSDQWRAAIYSLLLKPGLSIGLRHPNRQGKLWRRCHDILVNAGDYFSKHTVLYNLSILDPLALAKTCEKVTMSYCRKDLEHFQQIAQNFKLHNFILIQPTARWAFKTWPPQSVSALINHFTQKGYLIVLTSGQNQEELAMLQEIIKNCRQPEKILNLGGQLTLTQLAVFIAKSKLYIGVDSAPMHMAAALQTPTVALFGPTNLPQWTPWQAPHTLIWAGDFGQIPHFSQIDTNTEERYLALIPVDVVIQAAEKWLANANA